MKNKITLDQANAVIRAHHNGEAREQRKVAEQFVGKFYRYRNGYSSDEKWWLYATVTKALDGGAVEGWTFQCTTTGELQVRPERHFWVDRGGYEEITPRAFWAEWKKFTAKVIAHGQLVSPSGKEVGQRRVVPRKAVADG